MASKKTSTKQKKSLKKSTRNKIHLGGGVFGEAFSPTESFLSDPEKVARGLTAALMDGDKEAFQEILEGYVRAHEVAKLTATAKIRRAMVYEAMDKTKNPTLGSICKIMKAFKNADLKKSVA